MPDAGEGGIQPVVVSLLDGIELVVVAAGTADGQSEKSFAG